MGSQQINFLASLVHPAKGNIAQFLLEEGFATYVGGEKIPAPGETSYRNSLFLYGVTPGAGVFSPPRHVTYRW